MSNYREEYRVRQGNRDTWSVNLVMYFPDYRVEEREVIAGIVDVDDAIKVAMELNGVDPLVG